MRRHEKMRQVPKRLRPRPPDLNQAAAERVARFLTTIFVEDVEAPLVEPVGAWVDHAGFDRTLCRAGVKRFVRKRRLDDWPEGLPMIGGHVLVVELSPGIRSRKPLCVVMGHEMN
jgi:hypothetical protein